MATSLNAARRRWTAGELKKFVVVLQPEKLSEEEQKRLHEELAKAMMAVQ
jgi:hypothetical protein